MASATKAVTNVRPEGPPLRQDLAASRTLARSERCRRVRVAHAGAMATLVRRKGSAAAPDGCSVAVGVVRNPCGPEPSNRGRSTTCVARSERCRRFRMADAGVLRVLVRRKGSAATANGCLTAAGRGGLLSVYVRAASPKAQRDLSRMSGDALALWSSLARFCSLSLQVHVRRVHYSCHQLRPTAPPGPRTRWTGRWIAAVIEKLERSPLHFLSGASPDVPAARTKPTLWSETLHCQQESL